MKTSSFLFVVALFFFGSSLNAQSWTEKAEDSDVRISIQITECHGYGAVILRAENISRTTVSKQLTVSMDMDGKMNERNMMISDLLPGEVRVGDCCSSSAANSNSICVIFSSDVELTADDISVSLN